MYRFTGTPTQATTVFSIHIDLAAESTKYSTYMYMYMYDLHIHVYTVSCMSILNIHVHVHLTFDWVGIEPHGAHPHKFVLGRSKHVHVCIYSNF